MLMGLKVFLKRSRKTSKKRVYLNAQGSHIPQYRKGLGWRCYHNDEGWRGRVQFIELGDAMRFLDRAHKREEEVIKNLNNRQFYKWEPKS